MKLCSACSVWKDPGRFSPRQSQCRPCRATAAAKERRDYPARVNARKKASERRNLETLRAGDARRRKRYCRKYPDRAAARASRRRAVKHRATPNWADMQVVEQMYTLASIASEHCGAPYHVDHIVPLKSDIVCGLHCPANLSVIPGASNMAKSNRQWPDMP